MVILLKDLIKMVNNGEMSADTLVYLKESDDDWTEDDTYSTLN